MNPRHNSQPAMQAANGNLSRRPRTSQLRRCDGVLRRDILQIGALSTFGIHLATQAMAESGAQPNAGADPGTRQVSGSRLKSGTAKNCILIWLDGGPSHLETFDVKPDAPAEVRGPLQAISTSVAGIHVSECLPGFARCMQDFAIIRSMTSPLGEHNLGTHYLQSGYVPTPAVEYPAFHSVAAFLQKRDNILPSNIAIPQFQVGGARFSGNGFLPSQYAPFAPGGDPAKADFAVRDLSLYQGLTLDRLTRRREYSQQLLELKAQLESGTTPPPDAALEQAFRLITSDDARNAFRIETESPATRQRYGAKTVGQSCLLARRLVERGVPFVTVNQRGWDTHDSLYTRLKEGYTGAKVPVGLIPSLDSGLTALVDDLKERGLWEQTLVVVMGEFGRTPKLNSAGGRDHWPRAFCVALGGGGVSGGQVIGASDSTGESPADRPVTPADLVCTIYHLLGLDPATELHTSDGRPIRLSPSTATLVHELLS